MQFTSLPFIGFYLAVLLYFIVPRRGRRPLLLLASIAFYMTYSVRLSLLMLASILVTWGCGLAVERIRQTDAPHAARRCRAILAAGLIVNLGILFLFKYLDFAVDSLNALLLPLNVRVENSLQLALPMGISFYTFQALGYLIDVYRGDTRAERNIVTYALFVSFFPQLVAAPIERSGSLLLP